MIKTYSAKDKKLKLSEHFAVYEFWCDGASTIQIDEELILSLEKLYKRLNCSKIIITSGYRIDGSTSQHCLGKAADVNCWYRKGNKEVRYQGSSICCAAEDIGFRGIGWIAGAAVHLDTRSKRYWFDETKGNKSIQSCQNVSSWYDYTFDAAGNLEKPKRK